MVNGLYGLLVVSWGLWVVVVLGVILLFELMVIMVGVV